MTNDKDQARLEHQIDENLKKVFQRHLEEDVPDRFMDLLSKLKQADEKAGQEGSQNGK